MSSRTFKLWGAATGALLRKAPELRNRHFPSVDSSPDGRWLAPGDLDSSVRIEEAEQ